MDMVAFMNVVCL